MTKKRNFDLVRVIGGFEVTQRTQDGEWNLTSLFSQWNKETGEDKRVDHFLELETTKKLVSALTAKSCKSNTSKSPNFGELELVDYQNVPKEIMTTRKGKYGGTYVCDLLLLEAAAYLDVNLKIEILEQYRDGLIEMRNTIADSYRDWTTTLAIIGAKTQDDFSRVQKCMNYAVFNEHHNDIRNNATVEQLKKMRELEKQICQMVEFGYIKTLADVREFLRKVWERDYPLPFNSVD